MREDALCTQVGRTIGRVSHDSSKAQLGLDSIGRRYSVAEGLSRTIARESGRCDKYSHLFCSHPIGPVHYVGSSVPRFRRPCAPIRPRPLGMHGIRRSCLSAVVSSMSRLQRSGFLLLST